MVIRLYDMYVHVGILVRIWSQPHHQTLIVVWMPLSWLNVNYINLHEIRTYI